MNTSFSTVFSNETLFQQLCFAVIAECDTHTEIKEKIRELAETRFIALREKEGNSPVFPKLKVLQFDQNPSFSNFYLHLLLESKTTDISTIQQFIDRDTEHSITRLALHLCPYSIVKTLSDEVITKFIRTTPNLENLSLPIKASLPTAITQLQKLKSLRASANDNITDASLETIGQIGSLRGLDIHNDDNVSIEGLRHLFPLTELIELDLQCCELSDTDIKEVVENTSNLSRIKISEKMISQQSLETILNKKSITHLHLTFGTNSNPILIRSLCGKNHFKTIAIESYQSPLEISLFNRENFPNLNKLFILYCDYVYKTQINKIQAQMPECKITFVEQSNPLGSSALTFTPI